MKAFLLRLAVIPVLALSIATIAHIVSNYDAGQFWPVFFCGLAFFGGAFFCIYLLIAAED